MSKRIVISVYDDDFGIWGRLPLKRVILTPHEVVERMAKDNNVTPMYIYKELAESALDELLRYKED